MFNQTKLICSHFLLAFALLGVLSIRSANADPLRVSDEDGRKAIVSRVTPALPPFARQAHISGKVVVEMTVAEDGNVEKVDVISGNPVLGSAVVNATKKWTFQPFKSNGQSTKALVRAAFDFAN
jgi:TonB family protein